MILLSEKNHRFFFNSENDNRLLSFPHPTCTKLPMQYITSYLYHRCYSQFVAFLIHRICSMCSRFMQIFCRAILWYKLREKRGNDLKVVIKEHCLIHIPLNIAHRRRCKAAGKLWNLFMFSVFVIVISL